MTWPNHYPGLSKPLGNPEIVILSLGAGVQSTTLALAASRGDIAGRMPDYAIFADTKWEPRRVREHLDQLKPKLRFPVIEISAGDIRQSILHRRKTSAGRIAAIPWFITNPDGSAGMGRRQCTKEYKIQPIAREVRKLLGVGPKARIKPDTVEMWIGISTDEVARMKPARQLYIRNRHPLIEADMSRRNCEQWLADRQERACKSACVCCPFQDNARWRWTRDHEPEEWADVCEVDRQLRLGDAKGMRGLEYMHPSRMPLSEAPIDEPDSNQIGFDMECEGMCGV